MQFVEEAKPLIVAKHRISVGQVACFDAVDAVGEWWDARLNIPGQFWRVYSAVNSNPLPVGSVTWREVVRACELVIEGGKTQ